MKMIRDFKNNKSFQACLNDMRKLTTQYNLIQLKDIDKDVETKKLKNKSRIVDVSHG